MTKSPLIERMYEAFCRNFEKPEPPRPIPTNPATWEALGQPLTEE